MSSPALPSATDLDLAEIYIQLTTTLRDLLRCSGGAVLIPNGTAAAVASQFGPRPLPARVTLHMPARHILAHMGRVRQPLALRRATPFPPPVPAPAADIAWIGAPLATDDHIFGYLSIVGRFRSGDERVVAALAQQAAATLRLTWRATLTQHHAQRARQLIDLDQQTWQIHDQAMALETILGAAMEWTGASHSCILASRQSRAVVLARRGYRLEEAELLQQIPPSLSRGLTGRAYRTAAVVRSDDILQDPDALPALSDTRSQIAIPICSATQVLGLIDLQSPQPRAFAEADEGWLMALGRLAARVIERHSAGQPALPNNPGASLPEHGLLISSRLAAVTDLAAGVAHEINNPLTTILGYTNLLLRDQSLPEPARADIAQIMVEGQRIATLVERFLRFAQPSSTGKRPLSIDEPLREAVDLLTSRLQENGVRVSISIPDEPPMVLGQSSQLEQVLLDLLQNAIESMSTSDRREIDIQIGEQGGWARVAIADTGRGIPPDLLGRVFEPGFTTKVEKGISRGLGLGLYAAHTIIQDHWGRIEVQSQVWRGSTFTVCLPAI